jgi:hypothetical protein
MASAGAATMPAVPSRLAFPLPTLPAGGLPAAGRLPAAGALPAFNLPAFTPGPLAFAGPTVGQVAAVIGPTIITTAPSTFINTNNQVSAGSAGSGGQVAVP